MRSLSVFTLLLVFCAPFIRAQQPVVIWGEEGKLESRDREFYMIGASEKALFLRKDRYGDESEWLLESCDLDSLQTESSQLVSISGLGEGDIAVEEVLLLDGMFWVLYSNRQKGGERLLYLVPVDLSGKAMDLPVLAGEVPEVKDRRDILMGLTLSPDSSRVLLYSLVDGDSKEDAKVSLQLFDRSMELQYRKELQLPYAEDVLEIGQVLVDNAGRCYLLSGIKQRKSMAQSQVFGEESKRYLVFNYNFQANKLKEFDVNLKDKWVIGVTCGLAETGHLAIGGFYSNDMYFSIAGTFFLRVDVETQSVLNGGMKPFDRDFLKQFNTGRRDDGGRELLNYYFDHFVLNPDGSVWMVAEQFYVNQRWMMDPATGRESVTYSYHYNDLIVVKITAEGKVEWTRRIPKRQYSVNDSGPFSSYALARSGNHLDILFNDDARNVDLVPGSSEEPISFSNLNKSVVLWTRISQDGTVTRKPLFSTKEAGTILKPRIAWSGSPGELIVFSQLRKNFRFVRVIFPD